MSVDCSVMNINRALGFDRARGVGLGSRSQQRFDGLVHERQESRNGLQSFGNGFISMRPWNFTYQVLASEPFEIVRSLTGAIMGIGGLEDFYDLGLEVRSGQPARIRRERDDRFHDCPDPRAIDVQAANPTGADLGGQGPSIQRPKIDERHIDAVQDTEESIENRFELLGDSRELFDTLATTQLSRVVRNGLDSQYAFAFAIDLECELPKVHLENRQIIDRSLDHDLEPRAFPPFIIFGARLVAKDGLQGLYVKRSTAALNEAMKNLIHRMAAPEEKIAAILCLKDRIGVVKTASLLFFEVQREAKARRVNPALADPDQAPYRAWSSHGLCDSGQACGAHYMGKTVGVFCKAYTFFAGLAGYILVPVQDDLCPEGRMAAQLDDNMPPLGIDNVKGVMVDVRQRGFPCYVDERSILGALDIPYHRRCSTHQDKENTKTDGVLRDIGLGDLVLALTTTAVDKRDLVDLGISPNTTAQTTCHAHKVRVVQVLIGAVESSPPHTETTRRLTQWKIGVQDNSIHTVVRTVENLGIMGCEVIQHVETLPQLVWSEHRKSLL